MARGTYQQPKLKRYAGQRPYFFIRVRVASAGEDGTIRRKEVRYRLGYCDEMDRRQALERREQVLRQLNGQMVSFRDQVILEQFAKIYCREHLSTLAPGGRKQQESLLRNHILPALGKQRLCEIGTLEIQAFLNRKAVEGCAWWTRRAMKATLSTMYSMAADWGYWEKRNPATRVAVGKKRLAREKRILADAEFQALREALPPPVRLLVDTAVSTGMRISEILGLTWASVDLERGLVFVDQRYYRGELSEPKTDGSARRLPLEDLTSAYAAMRPASSGRGAFVFEEGGHPLDDRALLQKVLRPAAEKLGIYFSGFGWHTFRRMHLTLIQEEGATTFEAMAQAGHSKPSMTGEYTLVGLAGRKTAVRKLQARLLKPGSNEPEAA